MIGDIYLFYSERKSFFSNYMSGELGGVNHSAIELGDLKIGEKIYDKFLIEARFDLNMVAITTLSMKKDRLYDVLRLKNVYRARMDYEKATEWVLSQFGKKYDLLQVLGIKLRRPFGRVNRYICSELVLEYYKAGGIFLCGWKDSNLVTPVDFQQDNKLEIVQVAKE